MYAYVFIFAVYVALAVGELVLRPAAARTFWSTSTGWTAVFQIVIALAQLANVRRTKRGAAIARSGELRLTVAGFSGTLDGSAVQIAWADIETARLTADAVVIRRRRYAGTFAIPLTAIGDVTALWTELDNRLVSKSNLIRSSGPRTVIANSAYTG